MHRRLVALMFVACLAFFVPAAAHAQSYSLVYSFCGQTGCADGLNPGSLVMQAADGNFYSTTESGGANYGGDGGAGTTFKLTPAGVETVLVNFCTGAVSNCAGGYFPVGAMIQGADGKLYGTTNAGGTGQEGTLYSLTTSGTWDTLYNFCTAAKVNNHCQDGGEDYAAPILGSDGNYYGVSQTEGSFDYGIAWQYVPSTGALNYFHTFCDDAALLCQDGEQPLIPLLEASDGNFYGVTNSGGPDGGGTAFQITPAGKYTVIYSFCAQSNCVDGSEPRALVEGNDGNFYGQTYGGGANSNGAIFKLTPAGTETVIYSFCPSPGSGCPDGQNGGFGMWPGSDGNLYGTALSGGDPSQSAGVLYKITTAGTYSVLHTFCVGGSPCAEGEQPNYAPTQGNDGALYGPAQNGGAHGITGGAIYRFMPASALPAPVQLTLSNSSVNPNTAVTLSWKVLNAFSLTMQQCYASVQGAPAGAGAWTGKQPGTYSSSTHQYTGSASITPTADGSFTYALTCGGIESGFATLTVATPKVNTTTTLAAAPNPAHVGQAAMLTATVKKTSGTGTPTGKVTFTVSTTTIGGASLNGSGVATLSATTNGLTPGTYPVVATYAGDSADNGSASSAVNVVLDAAATTTTVTASPNPVTPPANCTLTVTVKRPAGYSGSPAGSVTFMVETTKIGSANLNASGVAKLTASTSGITPGSYPVTATYNGDSGDTGSSGSVTVMVQ